MMYRTSVPGHWGTIGNENPRAAPSFKGIPSHPTGVVRLAEEHAYTPAVLLAKEERPRTLLETAILTPLPDEGEKGCSHRTLALPYSGDMSSPNSPKEWERILRDEEWRRILTVTTKQELFPEENVEGDPFLRPDEVEARLEKLSVLEQHQVYTTRTKRNEVELPPMKSWWTSGKKKNTALHVYLTTEEEANDEPSKKEKVEELRRVLQIGNEKTALTEKQKERVFELCASNIDSFAFS